MENLDVLTARLADPAFFLEPEFTEVMAWLRHHSPVHWCQPWPERGFWAVTRHADLKAVYERPEVFSNEAAGNIIPADPNLYLGDRDAMGFRLMTANTDPPRHGELRRVYSRYFSGPKIGKLEGFCQEIVDEILDELEGRETFDFVNDVAAHLPSRLICRLLGVPKQDWPYVYRYANSFACFADPDCQLGDTPGETFMIAMRTTFDYISDLVEKRRAAPEDDLCSLAATAEINGEPMPHAEAAWNSWAVLAAGFETSRNAITGGLLALIENPDQMEALKADPKLLITAADEMIRWSMPSTANLRVALEDSEIAGQPIAKGEWVVLFQESANRDETVFADPFKFDIRRRPNPHLGFGHGIHNCLGRMLAMLEIKVMIRTMLERTDQIEVIGPLTKTASTIAKGLSRMPVRVVWKQPEPLQKVG